jgi:hypothetical protein
LTLDRLAPTAEREVDPLWMLRESLGERTHDLMPDCGWLPDDWLAGDALRRAIRHAARATDIAMLAG